MSAIAARRAKIEAESQILSVQNSSESPSSGPNILSASPLAIDVPAVTSSPSIIPTNALLHSGAVGDASTAGDVSTGAS